MFPSSFVSLALESDLTASIISKEHDEFIVNPKDRQHFEKEQNKDNKTPHLVCCRGKDSKKKTVQTAPSYFLREARERRGEKEILFANFFCLQQCHPFLSIGNLEPSGISWFLAVLLGFSLHWICFFSVKVMLAQGRDMHMEYFQLFLMSVSSYIPREIRNDHKLIFHSCREKASKGESWLQVIQAHLNRTIRSSCIKYVTFSS